MKALKARRCALCHATASEVGLEKLQTCGRCRATYYCCAEHQKLHKLGVADNVIPEPLGGAHRDRAATIDAVGKTIASMIDDMSGMKPKALVKARRDKFLALGDKGLAA